MLPTHKAGECDSRSCRSHEHATRPQTIGYGLVDSPAFLAAWVVEKFWSWTDHDGSLDAVLSRDDLLAGAYPRVSRR
jgi:hypothetical protein